MAKVLWVEDEEQMDKSYPGCMSSIFHVKKILPHRKRNRRCKRISDDQDFFEVLKLFDAKTSHILVDRKTLPTHKRSLKARIKALISEDNDKDQDQDFISSPKLQRTYSIHHLETNEWVHPIIFFPENVTESASLSRNLMPMKLEDKLNEIYTISKAEKMKNPHDDVNSKNIIHLRRVSSLNESATRFLEFSVGKEATLRTSRSLKLTYGSENLLRNDLNQGSRDTYFLRSSSQSERNPVSLSLYKDKYAELNSTQDWESLNKLMDRSDTFLENECSPKANSPAFCEDAHELKVEDNNFQISREMTQESSILLAEYRIPDEKVQISEGFQENVEEEIKTVNNKKQMKSSTKDDDFTYVKKILERSGFIKYGFQQPWYSTIQPLDPLVFQEIESHNVHDPERFAEEVNALPHRLLIFDLVDEVLLTIYERSCTHYPKKLSSYSHISPTPNGSLVLDRVWNSVSRLLNFEHDINESLNDIVSRDLRSGDGWMNLQLNSEYVGLDLEDVILDEVLEEVVSEFI